MATQYKTRCPHCAAQFKITEEHLKQAKGAVRCGSCLQIFQATDHLVDPPPMAAGESSDRWAGALEGQNTPPEPKQKEAYKPARDDVPNQDTDGLSIEGMELSDSFMNLEEGISEDGLGEDFSDMAGAGRSTHNEGADESWAEALLDELEENDEPAPKSAPAPAPPTKVPSAAPRQQTPAPTPAPAPEAPAAPVTRAPAAEPVRKAEPPKPAAQPRPPEPRKPVKPTPPPQEDDDDTLFGGMDLFADDLNDEPVAIPTRPVRERDVAFKPQYDWYGLFRWTVLSILAAAILVGQYAWFNYDHLARSPQWRPLYQQACDALGCELPSRSDISKLRGANLVVRSHPDYRNALIVDAILFNEARYPQPFPDLELRFSALDGKPVASRRFKPAEYLQGDLSGMETMPINTPLHVSLEIVDPGDSAVNYNLRLLPSQNAADTVSQR